MSKKSESNDGRNVKTMKLDSIKLLGYEIMLSYFQIIHAV